MPIRCGQAPPSASKDAVVIHETTLRFSDQPDPSMPDHLIADDSDPGSNQLLKTRLLEIVSQLIFTLQLAKVPIVVCQDVYPDLIAFVSTRLFEICRAKVGLLTDEIYISPLPNLQQIFNSELEATHRRTHLERARLAKREKRIQRKQILDDAANRL
jgi:hypothetical protein